MTNLSNKTLWLTMLFLLLFSARALALEEPNLYELARIDGTIQVTYNTSSLAGPSQFNLKRNRLYYSFEGDQIRTQTTELGVLVTVTLKQIPDLKTVTATLIIPSVNVAKGPQPIKTRLIFTTHLTSFGGPEFVDGQAQKYRVKTLSGTASKVDFLQSRISGKVTRSPTCPGPQKPNESCEGPMAQAAIEVSDLEGNLIASTTSDETGLFEVQVPPGRYRINVNTGDEIFPSCPETSVNLTESAGGFVNIMCDTGIR